MRRSTRQWFAALLVPTVAANMVNARLASLICLIARRSALRGNRSATARVPRAPATLQTLTWSMTCRFCAGQCAFLMIGFAQAPRRANACCRALYTQPMRAAISRGANPKLQQPASNKKKQKKQKRLQIQYPKLEPKCVPNSRT